MPVIIHIVEIQHDYTDIGYQIDTEGGIFQISSSCHLRKFIGRVLTALLLKAHREDKKSSWICGSLKLAQGYLVKK